MLKVKNLRLFWFLAILGIILIEIFVPAFILVSRVGGGMAHPFYNNFERQVLAVMPYLLFLMYSSFIVGTLFLTSGLLGVAKQYRKIENGTVYLIFFLVVGFIFISLMGIFNSTMGY